jgi:hypothetical protein
MSISTAPSGPANEEDAATFVPWWGEMGLEPDRPRRWSIGPRRLWAWRSPRELSVAHRVGDDPHDTTLELGLPEDVDVVPPDAARLRFAVAAEASAPQLRAALADRAAVVRPETSLSIPPGEEVTLYVSSPVWLRIVLPSPAGKEETVLCEIPTWRPSDTWFGPNTLRGELAYALATTGRLALEDRIGPPHRAVTPIRIRNRQDEPLGLERLKIPLPNLALYASRARLWTTALTLDHEGDDESTALSLTTGAPDEAGPDTERLAAPRQATGGNLVMRAFARVFGND